MRLFEAVLLVLIVAGSTLLYQGIKGMGVPRPSGGEGVVYLRGAGATFPYPQFDKWFSEYMRENPGVVVEYQAVGSGAGQEQFFKGLVDFCGSDPPLSREMWEEYRGRVLQLPVILGAIVVSYNIPELPGDRPLNLSGRVLALIYLGEIEYWDDPRILELNPGFRGLLPHARIIAVHRSDSSGTTQVFTHFLHKAAPDLWGRELVGKAIDWPVDGVGRGIGGKGNPGVVAALKSTRYSVGYLELSYALAEGLPTAAIMNREGVFVEPTAEAVQEAARNAVRLLPSSPDGDFSGELDAIVYAPGEGSYPITTFSHIIVWRSYPDPRRAGAVAGLLEWIALRGADHLVEGYVAVPPEVRGLILKAAEMIAGGVGGGEG